MESQDRSTGAVALWGILCANVVVYLLMGMRFGNIRFSAPQAAEWGAIYAPWVRDGETWRLFAANYIHFDLRHIVFNMLALLSWGGVLAARLGFVRFFLLYTASGLAGSLASLWSHPSTVCAGASGAISGILGALVGLYFLGDPALNGAGILQAVGYSAAYSFIMPSIDWQAHAGGFVGGAVLGFLVLAGAPKRDFGPQIEADTDPG
jgi:rhomboid protease GluP